MKNLIILLLKLDLKTKIKLLYFSFVLIIASITDALTVGSISPFLNIISSTNTVKEINPLFTKIIDASFLSKYDILTASIILFISFILTSSLLRLYNLRLMSLTTSAISVEIARKLFSNYIYQNYEEHINDKSNNFVNLCTREIERFTESVGGLFNLCTSSATSLAILVTLTLINPKITFSLIIIFSISYFIISKITINRFIKNGKFISQSGKKQIQIIQESSLGFVEMLLNSNQSLLENKYFKNEKILRTKLLENQFLSLAPKFILEAILIIGAMLLVYLVQINQNSGSGYILSTLGVLALGGQKLLPSINQIYSGLASIRANSIAVISINNSFNKTKNTYIDRKAFDHSDDLIEFNKLSIKNVSYSYRNKELILKNINLEIKKGEKIGLIGTTGSGKTTLINLIMGLLRPIKGEIKINDESLFSSLNSQKKIANWQSIISHVPQDIFLKDGNIAENISYSDYDFSRNISEIKRLARIAQLDDLIKRNKEGIFFNVGERGNNLSGGQKQRIGIARALYKKSSFLILDEATSALDNETEAKLIESIEKYFPNLTIISIAHRITSLKNFDRIIIFKDGCLSQSGSYKFLLENSSYFRNLIQYENIS
tara:strand:- start:2090 stop:3904 length:1815 start_codon:yes stop_codon:yes gene_type:complete